MEDSIIVTTEKRLAEIIDARIDAIIPKLEKYQVRNKQGETDRLSLDEAVEFLKEQKFSVTRSSLYNRIHQQTIPYQKIGRRVFFSKKELNKWLNSQTVTPDLNMSQAVTRIAKSASHQK